MNVPCIMHFYDNEWHELYGHGCRSWEEADEYVADIGRLSVYQNGMYVARPGREAPVPVKKDYGPAPQWLIDFSNRKNQDDLL